MPLETGHFFESRVIDEDLIMRIAQFNAQAKSEDTIQTDRLVSRISEAIDQSSMTDIGLRNKAYQLKQFTKI